MHFSKSSCKNKKIIYVNKRLHPIFLGVKSFYFAYLFLQNSQKRLVIMLLGCVKMAIVKNIKNKIKIPKKNLKNIILYSKRVLWGVIAFLLCFSSVVD